MGGTSGANKDEKSGIGESKNKGFSVGSINSADAPDRKVTAASISQYCFIASYYTLIS